MIREQILDDYSNHCDLFRKIERELETTLEEAIRRHGIEIHALSSRIKPSESLKHKASRPDKIYQTLGEITDVIGLRIVTYFEDAIEQIARILEEEFEVDYHNSIDKRRFLDFNKFGYRSLHYVCHVPKELLTGIDLGYDLKFEVQIRTILQHAWAEIEHDLGYKAQEPIPRHIRRRFTRIASLLEIADEEFVTIRRFLEQYEAEVDRQLHADATRLQIDKVSLNQFVRTPRVEALDRKIAERIGGPLVDELFFPNYLVKLLKLVGIVTIRDLDQALEENEARVLPVVEPYFVFTGNTWQFSGHDLDRCYRGYSLFFLGLVVLLGRGGLKLERIERATQFFRELDYPRDIQTAREVASRLVETIGPIVT